jgi:hypothetical protein
MARLRGEPDVLDPRNLIRIMPAEGVKEVTAQPPSLAKVVF